MSIPISFTDYCPFLDKTHTITIDLTEIKMARVMNEQYQKMAFDCDYAQECTSLDNFGRCPLFLKAPSHP